MKGVRASDEASSANEDLLERKKSLLAEHSSGDPWLLPEIVQMAEGIFHPFVGTSREYFWWPLRILGRGGLAQHDLRRVLQLGND
jgi:hypothetical protein